MIWPEDACQNAGQKGEKEQLGPQDYLLRCPKFPVCGGMLIVQALDLKEAVRARPSHRHMALPQKPSHTAAMFSQYFAQSGTMAARLSGRAQALSL